MRRISIIFYGFFFLLISITILSCNATNSDDEYDNFTPLTVRSSNSTLLEKSSDKTENALDNKSAIRIQAISYIDHYIVDQESIPENKAKRFFRLAAKIVTPSIIGSITGIPLISPACSAVDNISVLAQLVAGGTYVTMGTAGAWITIRVLDPLEPMAPEERLLHQPPGRGTCFKQLFSAVAAVLTSVPDIYVAHKYNNSSMWAVIPAFVYSFISKQLGYYELTSIGPSLCKKSSRVNEYDQLISDTPPLYSKTSKMEEFYSARLINREVTARLLDSEETGPEALRKLARQYVSELMEKENTREEFNAMADSIRKAVRLKRIVKGISLILPVANAFVNVINSYDALGLIYKSVAFQGVGTVLITLPVFSLDTVFTMDAFGEIFDNFYLSRLGMNERHFMESYFPRTYRYIIPSVSFGLSLCLAITSGYIVYDTLDGSTLHALKYVLTPLVSATNTVLGTYAGTHVYNTIFKGVVSFVGKVKEKTLISIDHHINKVSNFIRAYLFSDD